MAGRCLWTVRLGGVQADASKNSVLDLHSLKAQLHEKYAELEERLEDLAEERAARPDYRQVNQHLRSTTDPDAAVERRGKPKLAYQVHRAVDSRSEVITATEVTAGDVKR